jgi:hypothetical protein
VFDAQSFWDPAKSSRYPATPESIPLWERAHGVALPENLAKALRTRDGGYVLDTDVRVLSLGEMWRSDSIPRDLLADAGLDPGTAVCEFAIDEVIGAHYLMACCVTPESRKVRLLEWYPDSGVSVEVHPETVDEFLVAIVKTSLAPSVSLAQISAHDVIAEDVLDKTYFYGGSASLRNVLTRTQRGLELFVHRTMPGGEQFEHTELPLPLKSKRSVSVVYKTLTIERRHSDGSGPWTLHLEPTHPGGIIHRESTRTSKGWKNSEIRGGPLYVIYESWDTEGMGRLARRLAMLK